MKAYTYLIKFKPTNKFYYGVRFKNIKLNRTPEDDFMKHYTTSSEQINSLIQKHGLEAFEWEIRKTFDTPESAIIWETKVLTRAKVLKRQDVWFNANVAGYKITTPQGRQRIKERHTGIPKTDDHKKNLSESQKGKPKINSKNKTPEYRELMSKLKAGKNNPRYGVNVSAETCKRISEAKKGKPAKNKGIPMSEEQRAKLIATKEKNKVLLTCGCGKTMRESHFKMYGHGDKCKQKT